MYHLDWPTANEPITIVLPIITSLSYYYCLRNQLYLFEIHIKDLLLLS